jgi:hypothetical protein
MSHKTSLLKLAPFEPAPFWRVVQGAGKLDA